MMGRLKGIIDMHIHSAPDIRQRKLDDLQLMEAAVERGVRAIVIKSHMVPTADRATIVNRIKEEKYGSTTDFQMFGSLVLNRSVGGINPWAVEASLKLGAKEIFLPTMTAENHCKKENKDHYVSVVNDGKIVDGLMDVFQLVKDYDVALGTGHISPKECFIVSEAARNAGVKKLIITHPEFHIVGFTLEEEERIVKDYDVLLEKVYAQPIGGGIYKKNLQDNVEHMRKIGCDHFIVSTDGGQMQNPEWYNTIAEYIDYLYDAGFTQEEIDMMTKTNPGRMLGLND